MLEQRDRTGRQIRSVPAEFTTRAAEDGKPVIAGYFSVFNSDYELWPGAVEQVAYGAFSDQLNCDVRALCNHDTRLVLGRTTAGTLSLKEDEHGLYGEIEVNGDDGDAMNRYARVQRGDVNQCSFGFDIVDEEFIDEGQTCRWIIRKVRLYEVSVVTFPAYEATAVTARQRDLEEIRARQIESWRAKMKGRLKNGTENTHAET